VLEAQAGARSVTLWTSTLRSVIIGWYALGALWGLSLPLWLIAPVAHVIWSAQSLGGLDSIPSDVAPQYIGEASVWVWALTVLWVAVDAAVIVGAVRRRIWGFALGMILLVPWTLYLPLLIWNFSPSWPWLGWATFIAVNAALFVWMLITTIRYQRHRRPGLPVAVEVTPA